MNWRQRKSVAELLAISDLLLYFEGSDLPKIANAPTVDVTAGRFCVFGVEAARPGANCISSKVDAIRADTPLPGVERISPGQQWPGFRLIARACLDGAARLR